MIESYLIGIVVSIKFSPALKMRSGILSKAIRAFRCHVCLHNPIIKPTKI